MAQSDIELRLNGKPLGGDPEIQITIDDIKEEDVYRLIYHEDLWPDVISDSEHRING